MVNKEQYRSTTIDILKGISIVLVLITHYEWTEKQRSLLIFPYAIDMAVPIFMIVSGYVGTLSFKRHDVKSFADAFDKFTIVRKAIRYTIPFLIAVVWQIAYSNIEIGANGELAKLRWLLNGTFGPGSYYYPVLMQMIFVFPIIYLIIETYGERLTIKSQG